MKKLVSLAAASALVLGTLAGCSSGSSAPAATTAAATTAAAAETQAAAAETKAEETTAAASEAKDPIWFALVAPLTGGASQYGLEQRAGAEVRVAEINAAGGIDGHEVKFDVFDSKNDATEVVEIARQIAENDKYMWVQGDFSSTDCMAAAPIYEDAGIVQMSSSASASAWCPMGNHQFMGGSTQFADANFITTIAIKKYMGYNKIAVLHQNNESGTSAMENIQKTADTNGLEIVSEEAFEVGETDFSSIISKLRQTDVECIVVCANYTEASAAIKQAREVGWDIPFMLSASSASDQIIEILGDQAEGVYADENFNRGIYEDAQYADLLKKFEETCGWTMTMYGALSYDTCGVLCNSAERALAAGGLTRDSFRDCLEATKASDFEGICGPFEFNEDGSLDRLYLLIQVENGKWVDKTDYAYDDK